MKIAVIVVLYLLSLTGYAQPSLANQFLAGFSAGVAEKSNGSESIKDLVVNPKVGYALNNKFIVITEFNWYKVYDERTAEQSIISHQSTTYNLGIGMRYNAYHSSTCGTFYIQSALYKRKKVSELDWYFTPGIFYDLSDKIYADASFDFGINEFVKPNSTLYLSAELGLFFKL